MHNPSHAGGGGKKDWVMSSASEVKLTGLLMIAFDTREAWTSGESFADAKVKRNVHNDEEVDTGFPLPLCIPVLAAGLILEHQAYFCF